jgi:hypothetical protein
MSRPKTIQVLPYFGLMPLAGVAMEAIHYVLGLRRLGYDAWYIEDNGANPYSPQQNSVVWDASYNVGFIRSMMERFGMGDRWAYWDPTRADSYHGLSKDALFRLYREADALINLCGTTKLREEHMACPVRILVDTDPIFEQIKLAQGDQASAAYIDAHNVLYTIGENLGERDCPVPLAPRTWHKTRPPVIPDIWPADFARSPEAFSTIATWQHSVKDIEFEGVRYQWSKHGNFLKFLDLPNRTSQRFKLAMITPNPSVNEQVAESGWTVVDPVPVSSSFDAYAEFISDSRGELTVAKDIYVRGRSGWFSDRSVSYLAMGRPVITQSTAFEKLIPTGRGLFAFQDWDDIFAALDAVNSDYARHCRAAREIASEHFDSAKVLGRMMRNVGL